MAYKAPIWEDGKSPAISAENLNNLSQAAEGAQVLYGNSAPTSSTEGAVGQFYLVVVADSDGNYPLYQCVAIANGSYTWRDIFAISTSLASKLGLTTPATVEDALNALVPAQYNGKSAQRVSVITESINFIAPDNIIGKIHVMLFGGGGGGGGYSTSYYHSGGGGGGGHMVEADIVVNPGQSYPIIIGAGGDGGANGANGTSGKKGGATTGFGLTAEGGDGGGGGTSSGGGRGGNGGAGGGGGSLRVDTASNGKTGPAGGNGSYGGGGAGGGLGGGGSRVYTNGGAGGAGGTYGGGGAGGNATKGGDTPSSAAPKGGVGGAGGTYGGRGSDGKSFASGSYDGTISTLSSGGTAVDSVSTFFSPYFLILKELLYASGGTESGSELGGGGYGDLFLSGIGRGGGGYGAHATGSGGAGYGDGGSALTAGGGGGGFFSFGARGGDGGSPGKAGQSGVACLIYYVSLEEETT